jgi:hypothetical protein
MKQVFLFLFLLIFLLSVSTVFAQANAEATSVQDEESVVSTDQVMKVSDVRRVVVTRDLIRMKKLETVESVKYDKKGGIIVPNASKGIKMTSQNSNNAADIKQAKGKSEIRKSTQQKPLRDLKDRSQAVKTVEKKSK